MNVAFPIDDNYIMRRIAIYREWDGQEIAAQIGPDIVMGIAGFGKTVVGAIRDLAYWVEKHNYELRGNCVGVEVAGTFVEVQGRPDASRTQSASKHLSEVAFPTRRKPAGTLPRSPFADDVRVALR